jgi:tetratricopeptide (TPR) repeat protein
VLSWTSQAVSADAATAFALLGIAPGPDIALPAAANLLALPTAATRALLRELENAHLIKRHAHNRYLMHDLLRLHAAEQAHANHTPADQQVALRRLTNFYAHTACLGGRLLAPQHPMPTLGEPVTGSVTQPLPDLASTITWFDAEHACLLASQRLAYSHGWDSQVYRLAWALDPYHRRRGHLDDQVTTWQLAVTSAQRLPDPAVRAHAHQMLGDAYAEVGRTTDALDHLNQALALAEHAGDTASQAGIHHSLGGSWERHGDHRRALDHAQQALLIFQSLDNTIGQARALNGVGWLQAWFGDYTAARANCEAALALYRRHPANGRQFGESATLDSLGYIAYRRGDYDEALDHYHQALAICRAQGHSFLEANVLQHIAETHLARHHFDQALDTWKQALDLYDTQHRLSDAQRAANNIAALERYPGLTRTSHRSPGNAERGPSTDPAGVGDGGRESHPRNNNLAGAAGSADA